MSREGEQVCSREPRCESSGDEDGIYLPLDGRCALGTGYCEKG